MFAILNIPLKGTGPVVTKFHFKLSGAEGTKFV